MAALRLLLGDQLSPAIAALDGLDRDADIVLMAEVSDETTYVPHHPKKIAFILSAMRHFADELRRDGVRVDYVRLDDPANSGSFDGEVRRAIDRHAPDRLILCHPGEYRVLEMMRDWQENLDISVEIRPDSRFVASLDDFAGWAKGRRQWRMEYFYREMRKKTGLLMNADGKPEGGRWNFDAENRKPLKAAAEPLPAMPHVEPDAMTRAVLDLVSSRFGRHFGDLDGFGYAVTRDAAEQVFERFIDRSLAHFGDYQDAMVAGEAALFHSVISMYLNTGLLDPLDACRRVERCYLDGRAPLNAVEGFIRQIIGWREYVRGIYWMLMPDYADRNFLGANRPLPAFYWTGATDMACMADAIAMTRREGYAHHIQRLMVTGNFALLVGVRPKEICDWYLAVYADAFDWVELPNTLGMAMHADGGVMGSKPYAASGKYIDRMSGYCRDCRYDVTDVTGEKACPFNALYWNFLMENREKLRDNARMKLIYASLNRMDAERRQAIRARAEKLIGEFTS
ncbi:MAG: cryptochrome/photolyase family protein [Rhodospirillales bacterium]